MIVDWIRLARREASVSRMPELFFGSLIMDLMPSS
jgi:hypothetical protein